MKDWTQYLTLCLRCDLWGFVALDEYYSQENEDSPSQYMDGLLARLNLTSVDPVSFHKVLLCVAVQLLDADFGDIIGKSCKLLTKFGPTIGASQIRAMADHYEIYGKTQHFLDAAAARGFPIGAGAAVEHNRPHNSTGGSLMPTPETRFRVALSFPGEHRDFVSGVAASLATVLQKDRVLYDKYHEAEFARPNLDTHLQRLYHDDSELIAVFLCAKYEEKEWCGLESRAIRDLIKKKKDATIMLFRFDDADVSGVFGIDGYISIDKRAASDVAGLILERLAQNNP